MYIYSLCMYIYIYKIYIEMIFINIIYYCIESPFSGH